MTGMGTISKSVCLFVACPLLCFFSWFYYMRQRCYTWRAELCDKDFVKHIYKPLTVDDMIWFRRPAVDPIEAAKFVPPDDNPGVALVPEALSLDEIEMLKEECKEWCDLYGRRISVERRAAQVQQLEDAGLDPEFVEHQRYVSDRHEDPRPPKAPWGCGDALQPQKLPPLLRALAARYTTMFPQTGRLRHVYIEYSAKGQFLRRPRSLHSFDGHEYVIIPLTNQNGSVVTFTPSARSKQSELRDAMLSSWTDQDIDCFAPLGAMIRVYSNARFRWSWSLRPIPYFGHPTQPLPLPDNSPRALIEQNFKAKLDALGLDPSEVDFNLEQLAKIPTVPTAVAASDGKAYKEHMKKVAEVAEKERLEKEALMAGDGAASDPSFAHQTQMLKSPAPWWKLWASSGAGAKKELQKLEKQPALMGIDGVETPHEAYIVLHFEGPVSATKVRRRTVLWELYSYGTLPKPESFTWDPDIPPTEEEVKKQNVFWWLLKNYRTFAIY